MTYTALEVLIGTKVRPRRVLSHGPSRRTCFLSLVKEKSATAKSMMASKNLPRPITKLSEGPHWLRVLAAELVLRLKEAREADPSMWPKTIVLHARARMIRPFLCGVPPRLTTCEPNSPRRVPVKTEPFPIRANCHRGYDRRIRRTAMEGPSGER